MRMHERLLDARARAAKKVQDLSKLYTREPCDEGCKYYLELKYALSSLSCRAACPSSGVFSGGLKAWSLQQAHAL